MRRQYGKIVWSLGVLEKAILRWRLKRKGFRGLQAPPVESPKHPNQDSDDVEEEFFLASRKQAEERVERSVVRVQAMFRSKRAQEEYSRMKLECNLAKVHLHFNLLALIAFQLFSPAVIFVFFFFVLCSWSTKNFNIPMLRCNEKMNIFLD